MLQALLSRNHYRVYANVKFNANTQKFTYISDNENIKDNDIVDISKMRVTNSTTKPIIKISYFYYTKKYRPQLVMKHKTTGGRDSTICVLPNNKTTTAFIKLCDIHHQKVKKAISTSRDIIKKILPTPHPPLKENRFIRALININFCLIYCSQTDTSATLEDIDIDSVNDNFRTITKQLNTVRENILQLKKLFSDLHSHIEFLNYHHNIMETIQLIKFHASSQYATLTRIYEMNQKGVPTYNIIKPEEIVEISKKLNLTLSENLNSIGIGLETQDEDIHVVLKIPIVEKWKTANLYRATPYPIYYFNQRYQAEDKDILILFNEKKTATVIQPSECDNKAFICHLNRPFQKIEENSPCVLTQIITRNSTCNLNENPFNFDFFYLANNSIYFSIRNLTTLTINCYQNQELHHSNTDLSKRGKFDNPGNCVIKNNEITILNTNYRNISIQASNIFKDYDAIDTGPLVNITYLPDHPDIEILKLRKINKNYTFYQNTKGVLLLLGTITFIIISSIVLYLKQSQTHQQQIIGRAHIRENSYIPNEYPHAIFRQESI